MFFPFLPLPDRISPGGTELTQSGNGAGKPSYVGLTPAEVIYRENKLRVLYYLPQAERRYPVPLLMVPALINRYYVLDLKPGRSLVEHLVQRGFDVYVLDWGIPGDEDRSLTFDRHVSGYLRHAVQEVLKHAGRPRLSLLGYCMGGTMTVCYTALYGETVANLVTLNAPVNFHDDGLLSLWTRPEYLNVDALLEAYGNVPPWLMQSAFLLLKPTSQLNQAVALYENLDNEQFVDNFVAMNTWINDNVPFPGEAFRKYIKELYQQNKLIRGEFTIDGRAVDISRITCPVLTVAAQADHIVPHRSATVLHDLVGSTDKELLSLKGGHIGVVAGSSASRTLWPRLAAWLAARSGAGAPGGATPLRPGSPEEAKSKSDEKSAEEKNVTVSRAG